MGGGEEHVGDTVVQYDLSVFRSFGCIGLPVTENTYNVDEVHRWDTLVHVEGLPERLGSAALLMKGLNVGF